jgi:hypothetical protein
MEAPLPLYRHDDIVAAANQSALKSPLGVGGSGIGPYGLIDSQRCNRPVLVVRAGRLHAPSVAFSQH